MRSNKKKQINQRKWARFKVLPQTQVKAKIHEGVDRTSQVQTLSLGGCSFLSRRGDARLLVNPKVSVTLEVAGQTLTIGGHVHYCQFLPQMGLDSNLVGIEFSWPSEQMRKEFGLLLGKAVSEGSISQLNSIET